MRTHIQYDDPNMAQYEQRERGGGGKDRERETGERERARARAREDSYTFDLRSATRQTNRQTDRQTDRQAGRQADIDMKQYADTLNRTCCWRTRSAC